MKLFKDISFWCIVLALVVVMVVHHMLSNEQLIEGSTNQLLEVELVMADPQPAAEHSDEEALLRTLSEGAAPPAAAPIGTTDSTLTGAVTDPVISQVDSLTEERNLLQESLGDISPTEPCDATCQEGRAALADVEQRLADAEAELERVRLERLAAGETSVDWPLAEETAHTNYLAASGGTVNCSGKTFLGIADTDRHDGHSANWGNRMIDAISEDGSKIQDYITREEDIPCGDYYYYKPHTRSDSGWTTECLNDEAAGGNCVNEANSGFYTLEHVPSEGTNAQHCSNHKVRVNHPSISDYTCMEQGPRAITQEQNERFVEPFANGMEPFGNVIEGNTAADEAVRTELSGEHEQEEVLEDGDTLMINDEDNTQPERCSMPEGQSVGMPDRVKGYFDVTCTGVENDYCRFVRSPGYPHPWLSCISPENNCQEFPLERSIFGRAEAAFTGTPIAEDSAGDDRQAQKRTALKDWFANECQLNERCPSSKELPDKADQNAAGSGGQPGHARGFFNASCRPDGQQPNDYCRFVGEKQDINETDEDFRAKPKRMWLSCISPHSPAAPEDGRELAGQAGCNNKFPERDEEFGWSLEEIDNDDAKLEFQVERNHEGKIVPVDVEEAQRANNGLTAFFNDMCTRQPCQDNLATTSSCGYLNTTEQLKATCGESIEAVPGGGYKQCILDGDPPMCRASDNKCNMSSH